MADTADNKRRLQSFDLVLSDLSQGEKYTLIDGSDLKKGQSISSVVKKASSSLLDDHCLIVFLDNPLGLQYLIGYRDDEGTLPFSTFADNDGKRRMDYEELSSLKKELLDQGFFVFCYYPFPNRKNCTLLYSDSVLPGERELKSKYAWIDENYHISAFDDYGVIDRVVSNGLFQRFSSSYILVIRKKPFPEKKHVIYSKYALSRDSRFALRTVIEEDDKGERFAIKRPLDEPGKEQLSFIKRSSELLSEKCASSELSVNSLKAKDDEVSLEYVSGKTFSGELSDILKKSGGSETALFQALFEYRDLVESIYHEKEPFKKEEGYCDFFGDDLPDASLMSVRSLDIDLIFENLIRGNDKKWTVIDYEWTFDFLIPLKYLYYRASIFFTIDRQDSWTESGLLKKLFSFFEISRKEEKLFAEMERCFQKVIAGDDAGVPLPSDDRNYKFSDIISGLCTPERIQIFYGRGAGYSEEDSKVIFIRNKGESFSLDIELEEDVKTLRIDPGELPVILCVKNSCFEMGDGTRESVFPKTTGRELLNSLFVMDNDPQLHITVPSGAVSYHLEFFFDRTKRGMIQELFRKEV